MDDKKIQGTNQGIVDSFNNPIKVSRTERRKKIKYFSKMFKDHVDKKPSVDIEEEDPEKQEKNIFKMQAWASRYGILLRKLEELGYDFEKNGQGIHSIFAKEGKKDAERFKHSGTKKDDPSGETSSNEDVDLSFL